MLPVLPVVLAGSVGEGMRGRMLPLLLRWIRRDQRSWGKQQQQKERGKEEAGVDAIPQRLGVCWELLPLTQLPVVLGAVTVVGQRGDPPQESDASTSHGCNGRSMASSLCEATGLQA